MTKRKVAVIGGGAAGMMSAVFAARSGDDVTVFEKNGRTCKKIYITGKGRCNVTNNCDIQTVIANTPTNGRFLYSSLNRFSPADTMAFFEENGVSLKTERGNRVFPVSDRAGDIAEALLRAAKNEGVHIVHRNVTDIIAENGCITGVEADGKIMPFDKVIIACGGLSYPLTGSTGDGYRFAKVLGHNIITPKPSLVPMETVERPDLAMDKLLLKNVSVELYDIEKNKRLYTDFGELQFMRYGVTGAVVLSASSHIRDMKKGRYRLDIDLKPALSEEKLDARLIRELSSCSGRSYEYMLHSLLPSGMIGMFIRMSGIPSERKCSEITKAERKQVISLLKCFSLTIKGFRPIEEAVITSGGVDIKEIDPKTMRSRLIDGLYFAGEVIDTDAYTGGFNLQAAFSTGVVAGEN